MQYYGYEKNKTRCTPFFSYRDAKSFEERENEHFSNLACKVLFWECKSETRGPKPAKVSFVEPYVRQPGSLTKIVALLMIVCCLSAYLSNLSYQ